MPTPTPACLEPRTQVVPVDCDRDFAPPTAAAAVDVLDRDPATSGVFQVIHRDSPALALKLADADASMPRAGSRFAGFQLVKELGRGAFGRVFLAEQGELADRPVVLKVSLDVRTEARALAKLLHTNIVPIYSIHRQGLHQAVCMPYCGAVTLHDARCRFRGETRPHSGKQWVTLLNTSHGHGTTRTASGATETNEAADSPILDMLSGLTHVQTVLWIGSRIAAALAHAHDRGILHRDLKPANVLLGEDGQPRLLDFNLATDTRVAGLAEVARLGGTLPFMPPEHLESFGGKKRTVDARGDLYALGVILFELLSGDTAFPVYTTSAKENIGRMVEDRRRVPMLRDKNPQVTPAVEAIVRKCLAFDPADRYANAHALHEDLERHLANLSLKHQREPSLRERSKKWAKRHPRLSSNLSIGVTAAVLLIAAMTLGAFQHQRRMRLEARETHAAFRDDARRFEVSLSGLPGDDRRPLVEAAAAGRDALGRYPAPDAPSWHRDGNVRHLTDADRRQLREETGVMLLMLAHATARADEGEDAAREALRLTEQAAACFPDDAVPHAVRTQRNELRRRLGQPAESQEPTTDPGTARDLHLAGWDHARHGRYAAAIPLLDKATRLDPRSLGAWFLLGRCHDGLGHDVDAVACYGTCVALQPDVHQPWFNRGLANLRRGDFKNAVADFDQALVLRPKLADAYFNRGLAKQSLGDDAGAEADFTAALDCGANYTRVYFVRADVRDRLKKSAEASADRREGLTREPVEESCWTARGFARMVSDPKAALADFENALARNPSYLPALTNKAAVLADLLNKPADAVATLDTAIAHHPEAATLWSSRAVYQARLGRRADAHRDAEHALTLSGDPATRYQVAGVYALTSKTHPDDRKESFRLLAMALQRDYGFEFLDVDPELAPVRELPEFKNLVSAAKTIRIPTGDRNESPR